MSLKKILLGFTLLLSFSVLAETTPWQEMHLDKGRMLVDAEINGISAKALIDTSYTSFRIKEKFLKRNNISFNAKKNRVKNVEVKMFSANFPAKSVKTTSKKSGKHDVVIGLDFLKNFIVQFDYPNKRVRLIAKDSTNIKEHANVNMQHGNKERSLVVSATLPGGEQVNLKLDTGESTGMYLERDFAQDRGWFEKYAANSEDASKVNKLTIDGIKFGPYVLEDVKVRLKKEDSDKTLKQKKKRHKEGKIIMQGAAYTGLLGVDMLQDFVVTLDASSALMHVVAP